MSKSVIKPKAGMKLRRVGAQYMIVDAATGRADTSFVYTLNRTAARLWEQVAAGNATADSLADFLVETYEVDMDAARADVDRQLAEWTSFGLVE